MRVYTQSAVILTEKGKCFTLRKLTSMYSSSLALASHCFVNFVSFLNFVNPQDKKEARPLPQTPLPVIKGFSASVTVKR